ncbi:MAG: helix-turn-helix domain-containing protein [Roseibium sp.]|uniref:helix-turn-helix transcriptional regulator n=1 Tax=Roseibium sp. TaxID=1936156 RepID=UPI0026104D53|nr:helix-turn-helix domain-containing protein [Roseibium sp.]MCV0426758.1 helix-turn-helix domain-containing protein [Roseibium sp.]
MARSIAQAAKLLNISPELVAFRAGLADNFSRDERVELTPSQVFDLWRAVEVEAGRPDLPLALGKLFAHAHFTPAMFAFSCSPDVRTGLHRLSVFKPLMAPITLQVSEEDDYLHVAIGSVDPKIQVPPQMIWFEAIFLLECVRCHTVKQIVPARLELPLIEHPGHEVLAYLGCEPKRGAQISLRRQDADLPLVTENEEIWPEFEKQLRDRMAAQDSEVFFAIRVKNALREMLPSGEASIEATCERMAMSKRTLQRQLKEEGETFQTILASTRLELAMHYLSEEELSIEEISFLLAYREPNSFFRAFQRWTGMTPAEARGKSTIDLCPPRK